MPTSLQQACAKCKQHLPTTDFYPSRPTTCKACVKAHAAAYKLANPERAQEWYSKYRASDKGRQRDLRARLATYGLTVEQYEALLAAQGGTCAICREEMATPYIDHCHQTGKVCGLLCLQCNSGIGLLRDDVRLARAAAAYLEATRAVD